MPAETQAMVGGVGIALGLARLNPAGLAMTGHDTGLASVVPVLSIRAAPALSIAVLPRVRDDDVGAAVIVSARLGR